MTDYAVIMQHPDGLLEEGHVEFFSNLDDAVHFCDDFGDDDDEYKVFRVEPVSESALWNWATRKVGTDDRPLMYVSESVARNCCPPGYEVVKQRKGSDVWQAAGVTR